MCAAGGGQPQRSINPASYKDTSLRITRRNEILQGAFKCAAAFSATIFLGQQGRRPAWSAEEVTVEDTSATKTKEVQVEENSATKTFVSSSKLFSFDYPGPWVIQAPKPVQTHQEEVTLKSTTVKGFSAGVAVDPVKIDRVEQAGSPADVGNRIVKLERKKDGVLSVELLDSSQESCGGKTYYLFDYKVESTRGKNRYVAKAVVQDKRLIVLTVQIPIAIYEQYALAIKSMITSFKINS